MGEFTRLNGAFIGMACIHFCHVDLPFLFCPEATWLLAGRRPQVQEAREFKGASDSPAVSWSVWMAPESWGGGQVGSGHEQKALSSFQPY